MLQPVITVHGVWTEGLWQEEIAPVLYPHFHPQSVKYGAYRCLGAFDLVFEPWVLFPGLLLWATAWLILFWLNLLAPWPATVLILSLPAILLVAHLVVHLRLNRTVQKFLDESAPAVLQNHAHVICHSLGSYLVCLALHNDPTMFAERVVLAGCVVDKNFAWQNLLHPPETKIKAVRNEVAGRDWVSSAARLLRWRFPEMGSAGRHGFLGDGTLVHTVPSPNHRCTACTPLTTPAPVHSFVSAKKGHSQVLKSTYTKYYWLPFFWGHDPGEFREFLDSCFEIMLALDAIGSPDSPPPTGDCDTLADKFLDREWGWTRGRTIARYIEDELNQVLNRGDQKIIAFNICRHVAQAEAALGDKVKRWRQEAIARRSSGVFHSLWFWRKRRGADDIAEPTYISAEYDDAIKALNPREALVRSFLAFINSRTYV